MQYQDLNILFKALDPETQIDVTEFFNLHNMAIRKYNKLSAEAIKYVNQAIAYSQEIEDLKLSDKIEENENKSDSAKTE